MTIPVENIIALLISAILTLLLPLFAALFLNKKYQLKWILFLVGALVFISSALILESLVHSFVFSTSLGDKINGNIWFLAIYGGLAAGLFEEVGRWIGFKLTIHKFPDPKSSLMVGIGHGGIEAILLVSLTLFSNAYLCYLVNAGTLSSVITDPSSLADVLTSLEPLSTLSFGLILVSVWERIYAMTFHLAMSIIVFKALKDKKIIYLFIAVLLHALFDFTAVLLADSLTIIIVSLIMTGLTVIVAAYGWTTLKKMMQNDFEERIKANIEDDVSSI